MVYVVVAGGFKRQKIGFTAFNLSRRVIKWNSFKFPSQEAHLSISPYQLKEDCEIIQILTTLHTPGDLEELLLLIDALKRLTLELPHYVRYELYVPFWPGARQDRVANYGEPLTTAVYANIINSLSFDKVEIFDPHSNVTSAVINNVNILSNNRFIKEVLNILHTNSTQEVVLVAPDLGASKKVEALLTYIKNNTFQHIVDFVSDNIIQGTKHRDLKSGQLSNFRIINDPHEVKGKNTLIVDDICDGGGTFLSLAQKLKELGAKEVRLAVSHGLFTKPDIYFSTDSPIDFTYSTTSVGYMIPAPFNNNKLHYVHSF